MSPAVVVPCGCCKALLEPVAAFFDTELQAHVCDDCRYGLKCAKAQLSRSFAPTGDAIQIRGCYQGTDAPDNQPSPPAEPETT